MKGNKPKVFHISYTKGKANFNQLKKNRLENTYHPVEWVRSSLITNKKNLTVLCCQRKLNRECKDF